MDTRRLQIGVMGAGHDLAHSAEVKKIAYELGKCVAESGHILVFGANKDEVTLPTDAARGAKSVGGLTVGVTYGTGMDILEKDSVDIVIASGVWKGGGREFVLVNSCDAIITISGGAGTLIETAIAYEMKIPIIALAGTGGWSDKLAGEYLDIRKRVKILPAESPAEAVRIAIKACR
jgi:uncharacterized protein (TIGR00725 family)